MANLFNFAVSNKSLNKTTKYCSKENRDDLTEWLHLLHSMQITNLLHIYFTNTARYFLNIVTHSVTYLVYIVTYFDKLYCYISC